MEELIKKLQSDSAGYIVDIAVALVILIVGIFLMKFIVKIAEKALAKTSLDESAHKFLISVMKVGLYVLLIVIILGCLNIPTAPIVTVLGACGAAIALALKDSLSDVASGLIILVKKPFKKGDLVIVGGYEGRVESIDINVTTIKTADNQTITIPNHTITGSVVTNESKEATRRIDLFIGISYGDSIQKAREVLLSIAQSHGEIIKTPEPVVAVAEHGASAVVLRFSCWVRTGDYLGTKAQLLEESKLGLDEAGITIPFNQMDVHMIK